MSPATYPEAERATPMPPYSVLLRVGFTWPASHLTAGALLPHRSTLTQHSRAVYFSVALSLGSPPLGVTQHPALWSSDFPQAKKPAVTRSSCSPKFQVNNITYCSSLSNIFHFDQNHIHAKTLDFLPRNFLLTALAEKAHDEARVVNRDGLDGAGLVVESQVRHRPHSPAVFGVHHFSQLQI